MGCIRIDPNRIPFHLSTKFDGGYYARVNCINVQDNIQIHLNDILNCIEQTIDLHANQFRLNRMESVAKSPPPHNTNYNRINLLLMTNVRIRWKYFDTCNCQMSISTNVTHEPRPKFHENIWQFTSLDKDYMTLSVFVCVYV